MQKLARSGQYEHPCLQVALGEILLSAPAVMYFNEVTSLPIRCIAFICTAVSHQPFHSVLLICCQIQYSLDAAATSDKVTKSGNREYMKVYTAFVIEFIQLHNQRPAEFLKLQKTLYQGARSPLNHTYAYCYSLLHRMYHMNMEVYTPELDEVEREEFAALKDTGSC
jgi:hypothetical protein